MTEKRSPLFLERQSYRRRRLIDLIRMVPIIGALLWGIPLLWRHANDATGIRTSDAIIYIFGCWLFLVLTSFVLARVLKRSGIEDAHSEDT